MKFLSFAKKNNKKEGYSLVFNISSGSVTGTIVKFTDSPGVDVVYSARESIIPTTDSSVKKRLDSLKSALTILSERISKEGLKRINLAQNSTVSILKTFYFFSSPWCLSQTKTLRTKETKSFKADQNYINKMISDQEKKCLDESSKSSTFSDISGLGKMIEKKIIQIKANGYIVDQVNNNFVKDLEVSLFCTVIPEEVLETVEGAVNRFFVTKEIWCHSLTLPIFSVLRDLFPQKDDFVYVNMTDEMTDIAVIRDGLISSEASFPLGRNYFVSELIKEQKVTKEIADSMIRLHSEKKNDELATLKTSVIMDRIVKDWLKGFNSAIEKLKEKIYIPDTLFIISSNDLAVFLVEKLKNSDYKIIPIDRRNIKGNDVSLKIGLLFLDKLYKI